nr:hypothetical protein [Paenibacillus larvae]
MWTPDEVRSVLGAEDGNWFCEIYDITDEGNFEGNSIPNQIQLDLEQYSKRSGIPLDDIKKRADLCRRKLFATREQRVHPHKDDKILTSWNSLMIMALAKGFQVLGREEYLHAAAKAVSFILDKLRRPDGRLLARYRKGRLLIRHMWMIMRSWFGGFWRCMKLLWTLNIWLWPRKSIHRCWIFLG